MKRFFFPLFWKFTIAIIIVVALFGFIHIFLIWNIVYSTLENESEKRARYIGHSLAQESVNPLLYDDRISLQQLIENACRIDTTLAYAFVLNEKNQLLVHTFPNGFPAALLSVNLPTPDQKENVQLITPRGSPGVVIRDIAVPILQGKLGTIRVGLQEKSLGNDVRRTIQVLLIMVGVFLIIGVGGAFLFARFINNPVQEISRVAGRLDLEALKRRSQPRIKIRKQLFGLWKIPWRAEDELDRLAEKFNEMISRLEDAYAELQAAQASIIQSEKLASVGTLSAGIAHEINNPLAGLQNCIRRISHNPENVEQNKKYLKMMWEAVEKMEWVIKGLLEYTRQERLDIKPVDIQEIVEKALLLTGYTLEKERITVTKKFSSDLPKIHGSPNHLQQVMVNLLLNSIDAIHQRCKLEPHCERKIYLTASVTKDSLLSVSVQDSGVGIPEKYLEKIFDPFFTTKSVGKGTGLGLSVCYNIIHAHGGRIEVKSVDGKGTTATIFLPINHSKKETDYAFIENFHRGR